MRWTVFALAAYAALALQVGLARHVSLGSAQPQIVLLLAVFVALSAPTRTAVVACGILGLFMDLLASPYVLAATATLEPAPQAATILGPYTLGYMAGGYLVVQLRPMLFRHHPLTMAAMALAAGAEAHLLVVGLLWLRNWYEPIEGFIASAELGVRGLGLLYTAGLGLLLAYPAKWITPAFAFHTGKHSGRGQGG